MSQSKKQKEQKQEKEGSIKAKLKAGNVKNEIDLHISAGIPFKIVISNYTTTLKSEISDSAFMKNNQSSRVFGIYDKIKKEVSGKPIEYIEPSELKYYQTGFNFDKIYLDEISNVDLKSAYATILLNDGFISEGLYKELHRIGKNERLAVVGMLASRKKVFEFNHKGVIVNYYDIVNPLSNYFYHCVKKTFAVMDNCKHLLGKNYLFSWVDSVYFGGGEFLADLVIDSIEEEFKIKSTYQKLFNFEVKSFDNVYKVKYLKEGKLKYFNIPNQFCQEREFICNYLFNIKNQTK